MAHLPTPPPQTARIWVGRNVRRYREERGLNIGQLAERVSELGFPLERTQISKIENGRTNVDVEKLLALATALDVLPDRLLRDPDELDAAIFDRLLQRFVDLTFEGAVAATRGEVIKWELEAICERNSKLQKRFDDALAEIGPITVRVQSSDVDFSSPAYGDYLDELLSGPEVEFGIQKETKKDTKKGGK